MFGGGFHQNSTNYLCTIIIKNNEIMSENEITFEKMPQAIAMILSEVSNIKHLIEKEREPVKTRQPIDIEGASQVIMKARSTIYYLTRKGKIPSYKNGKKIYFYKDELLAWVDAGKRKTTAELKAEIEAETKTNKTKRPTRRD